MASQLQENVNIPFVGIAVVVNDSVPFRYPLEADAATFRDEELGCVRLRRARTQFWRLTQSTFAELFLPSNSEDFYGDNLELVVDALRLVCFPLKTTAKLKFSSVVSFSVVLALDASMDSIVEQSRAKLRTEPTPTAYGKAFPLSLAGIRPYRIIAKDFANALLFAESVDGYVSNETKLALEGFATSLQKELKFIFHDLIDYGTAEFRYHNRTCASFTLLDPKLKPTMDLRPYHSVVIVRERNRKNMEMNNESSVDGFSEYFNQWGAMKSLQDAADELGMSLEQAIRFASYLRQWKGARIVHKLQDFSMFSISPAADLHRDSGLVQQFASKFPGYDLSNVLSQINLPIPGTRVPKRLKDFISLYGDKTRPIFSWMLQHDVIVELFQFIYFVPPSVASRMSSRRGSFNAGSEPVSPINGPLSQNVNAILGLASAGGVGPQLSPPPQANQSSAGSTSQRPTPGIKTLNEYVEIKVMNPSQIAYIKSVWDLSNPVFRTFLKVCSLFGGTNHVQELLFRTGMSTGALKIVMEQYSDCLFAAIHEL